MPARADKAAPVKPGKKPGAGPAKGASKATSAKPAPKKVEKKPLPAPTKAPSKGKPEKPAAKPQPKSAAKVAAPTPAPVAEKPGKVPPSSKAPASKAPSPPPAKGAAPSNAKAATKASEKSSAKGAPVHPVAVPGSDYNLRDAVLGAFATSNRINRYLIENLADDAWRARPLDGKGRTIASIVAHIHNVRVMWLQAAGVQSKIPDQVDKNTLTRKASVRALDESHHAIEKFVAAALNADGVIPKFPAGVAGFIAYLMTHDAHHRGQICLMARHCGKPVPQEVMFGMWEWSKR